MLEKNLALEIELKNLSDKIDEFYNSDFLTNLEKNIVKIKYIDLEKNINTRQIAKNNNVSIKKVNLAIEKIDTKLFSFLKKYV